MSVFNNLNISSSGLTAQHLRMDVISANLANADSTRGKLVNGKWQPYQRQYVNLQSSQSSFSQLLKNSTDNLANNGVKVANIENDTTPFKEVYDPSNPDANAQGYVEMPNVDTLKETVDLMSASRSYEANVTAFNSNKAMLLKTLEIGK